MASDTEIKKRSTLASQLLIWKFFHTCMSEMETKNMILIGQFAKFVVPIFDVKHHHAIVSLSKMV